MIWYHPKYYAALRAERKKLQAASDKPQAPSVKQQEPRPASAKLQASSSKRIKKIPASFKPQAERFKIPAGCL